MSTRRINLMPDLREQARKHPDMRVTEDGAVTLKEGVREASVESKLDTPEGYSDE